MDGIYRQLHFSHMTQKRKSTLGFIALSIIFLSTVIALSIFLDRTRPTIREGYEDEDLSLQAYRLRGFSFGMEGLIADWYWMRSLQYVGHKIASEPKSKLNIDDLSRLNPRLLHPLLDAATTLDPKYISAYSFGAIVLPSINQNQAINIAEKGIENNPDEWRLYQHLGYIYWKQKDYEKAAEIYSKASKIDGAPAFFELMAAKMKNEGGLRETAREIYRQMLANTKDSRIKASAKFRLEELDRLDQIDLIQESLDKFRETKNRCPKSFVEILPLLIVEVKKGKVDLNIDSNRNIVDPTGIPYLLDRETCKVKPTPKKDKTRN